MWPKEDIPNAASVFMRIHRRWAPNGEALPGAFRDHAGGMSVDWDKYSTPEETRARGRLPSENGVIGTGVGAIRTIEGLSVEHAPIQEDTHDPEGNLIRPA